MPKKVLDILFSDWQVIDDKWVEVQMKKSYETEILEPQELL